MSLFKPLWKDTNKRFDDVIKAMKAMDDKALLKAIKGLRSRKMATPKECEATLFAFRRLSKQAREKLDPALIDQLAWRMARHSHENEDHARYYHRWLINEAFPNMSIKGKCGMMTAFEKGELKSEEGEVFLDLRALKAYFKKEDAPQIVNYMQDKAQKSRTLANLLLMLGDTSGRDIYERAIE